MKTIHYQILRYLPDRVAGEFVNLGIVAYDVKERSLQSKFISRIGNISSFFPNINSRYLLKSVKTIQDDLVSIANRFVSEFVFEKAEGIQEITQMVLPKDDSALIFSEVKKTLDINVSATVDDLFNRFVSMHFSDEEDEEVRRDKEVWNKVYKKYFDEYGVSNRLKTHTVKTQNDELEFEKSWKNGVWNCFETVSFNLTRTDAIKNKVYKWVGKFDQLNKSDEAVHVYLLSILSHEHAELNNFIKTVIKEKSTDKIKVDIVSEDHVQNVVETIKAEMDKHD